MSRKYSILILSQLYFNIFPTTQQLCEYEHRLRTSQLREFSQRLSARLHLSSDIYKWISMFYKIVLEIFCCKLWLVSLIVRKRRSSRSVLFRTCERTFRTVRKWFKIKNLVFYLKVFIFCFHAGGNTVQSYITHLYVNFKTCS